ncbi:MAG: hypothetical protein ACRDNF_12695 [Streptosporangiaceae bacterium]
MRPNAITLSYLDEVTRRGLPAQELIDLAHRSFDLSRTTYSGHCLSRPAFLDYAERAQIEHDVSTLQDMLTSLPTRMFGGDMAAFARAVGMTPAQVTAIQCSTGPAVTRLCRVDTYPDETGFKIMESNHGSPIGALDSARLNRAFLSHPLVAEFAAAHRLSYDDPMVKMVKTLWAECGLEEGAKPLMAAVDVPEVFSELEPQLRYSAEQLAELGVEIIPCHLGQLELRDRRVWVDGRPIDVIYRIFLIEDMLTPEGEELIMPVLKAAERGEVTIFTPMDGHLYGSKGALAMLSDEINRHLFIEAELDVLDRFVPWTRMVRPGPVTVGGETAELLEYAAAERENLIHKPTLMHGGIGVEAGWLTEPADWDARLKAAVDGPFVLQRRIRPPTEAFPGPGGMEDWVLGWGVFLGTEGFGGSSVRGHQGIDVGVPSVAARMASLTCSFYQEAPV